MKEFSFWNGQDSLQTRPIDCVVAKQIPPTQVSEFIGGCRLVYAFLKSLNPDVIFVPERGASPISWTVSAFGDLEHRSFTTLHIPLGTNVDIHQGSEQKSNYQEKGRIVDQAILYTLAHLGDIKRPALIDEVQKGSTIQRAARLLAENLAPVPINVIAVIDTRSHEKRMAKGFKSLVEGRRPNQHTSTFALPLFFTDRQAFLNYLLRPSGAKPNDPRIESQMQMILHNSEAASFFQHLVMAFDNPHALREAIRRVEDPSLRPSSIKAISQKLYQWLEYLFSDQRSLRSKSDQVSILNWLQEFAQAASHE